MKFSLKSQEILLKTARKSLKITEDLLKYNGLTKSYCHYFFLLNSGNTGAKNWYEYIAYEIINFST